MKIKKIIQHIFCLLIILLLCLYLQNRGCDDATFTPSELWFEEKSPDDLYSIVCTKFLKYLPYSNRRVNIELNMVDSRSVLYGEVLINNKGKDLDQSNYDRVVSPDNCYAIEI